MEVTIAALWLPTPKHQVTDADEISRKARDILSIKKGRENGDECQNHIQPPTKDPTQAYASGVMGALFIEREKLAAILALQLASSASVFFAYGSAKLSRSNETL